MKLNVPYTYTFWYVPTRCQNERNAITKTAMEVEIAELDDAAAPVVMTVANHTNQGPGDKQGFKRFFPLADGSPRRVRMRDGQFYVEGMTAEEFTRRASSLETLDSTFLAEVGRSSQRKPGFADTHGSSKITSVGELRWGRNSDGLREDKTRDDGGAKVGRRIARQAANMFVVDGVTYELCREPILKIKFDDGGAPVYGIVEAFESVDARMDYGKYSEQSAFTSSLIHAEQLIAQVGIEKPAVSFKVVDTSASSYDGVASDIVFHLVHAEKQLKNVVSAAPTGVLQAYYRLAEALRHVDRSSPSISAEVIAAARGLLDISVDPEIDEPMRQLANARYLTETSQRRAVFGPDHGSPFHLHLDHVSGYEDRYGQAEKAKAYASRVLDRWEGRHPASTFDNGQTDRMTTRVDAGVTVAEIGSDAQARLAAREVGLDYGRVKSAITAGSRLFRLAAEKLAAVEFSQIAKAGVIGLVIGPAPGDPNGHWSVDVTDHPKADLALDAVSQHVEAMDRRDMEISQDQQLISIF
ncbi:hypothetical protein HFN89_06975 [Rhizobium laguerreae]|nr:hypothetical protein [Rhizobium laguerreae]